MNAIKLGPKEMALLLLIAITGAMALRDRLPASQAEIVQIGRLAATNVSAMREYYQSIESEPSMSIREARQLREKIEIMSGPSAPASHLDFGQSDDDAWWRVHIRPLVPYVLGAIGVVVALQISRARRNRHTFA